MKCREELASKEPLHDMTNTLRGFLITNHAHSGRHQAAALAFTPSITTDVTTEESTGTENVAKLSISVQKRFYASVEKCYGTHGRRGHRLLGFGRDKCAMLLLSDMNRHGMFDEQNLLDSSRYYSGEKSPECMVFYPKPHDPRRKGS